MTCSYYGSQKRRKQQPSPNVIGLPEHDLDVACSNGIDVSAIGPTSLPMNKGEGTAGSAPHIEVPGLVPLKSCNPEVGSLFMYGAHL